jgi:hypothetical protein
MESGEEIDDYLPEGGLHRRERQILIQVLQLARGIEPDSQDNGDVPEKENVENLPHSVPARQINRKKVKNPCDDREKRRLYKELGFTIPYENIFPDSESIRHE